MNKGKRIRPRGVAPTLICDEAPCPNPNLSGCCHVFRGAKTQKGYGQTSSMGKSILTHRYAWEMDNGPIPAGLEIDHQCRNRACCNTDHLRAVTKKVNLTENVVGSCWQLEAAKTHCPKGHAYDAKNTAYRSKPNGSQHRYCRACNRHKASLNRKKRTSHASR